MAQATPTPASDRRALLRGAIVGLGAAAAGAALTAEPAAAANGDSLVLGKPDNRSSSMTGWIATGLAGLNPALNVLGDGDSAIRGTNNGTSGAGVHGIGDAGPGVRGSGPIGVDATGGSHGLRAKGYLPGGIGVSGEATATSGEAYGVLGLGRSNASRAVFGWNIVPGPVGGGTGVFGQANGSAGVGVRGYGFDGDPATGRYGTGVLGFSGVHDKTLWPKGRENTGVLGISPSGTGVAAESARGTALRVTGRAAFTRSGRAAVPKRRAYVDVVVPGGLTSRSIVQATLQTLRPGIHVAAAVPNPATGKVRITLSGVASRTRATSVAWIVTEIEPPPA